tara:strand:+ start:9995 stop:10789 length:795 start_codon:yes stop_codon:yes gene_type:complete
MLGVLLTSTCYYENIDKETFSDRVEELVNNIVTLEKHVNQPFELIVADNSPPDCAPTEKILQFRPKNTLFIRETENPGKSVGEATLIRDGIHLSFARGHKWLLKLSGRYSLAGNWLMDETIKYLEEKQKLIYINLHGRSMKEMPWAKGHPYYEENLNNDKILVSVSTEAFMISPEYLISNGVFRKEYLYREYDWVNFEQLLWYAIKDLNFMHWPELPIDGFDTNKRGQYPYKKRFQKVYNPIFETTTDFKAIPQIDIAPLIENV